MKKRPEKKLCPICFGSGIDRRGMFDTYCKCEEGEKARDIGCLDLGEDVTMDDPQAWGSD